jgi:hypothetical protein
MTMEPDFSVRLYFKPWEAVKVVHLGNYPVSIAWDMARVTAKAEGADKYSVVQTSDPAQDNA